MPRRSNRRRHVPKLCWHRARQRAYVTDPITKREHYFQAEWGSKSEPSRALQDEYNAWCAKLAMRRKGIPADLGGDDLTVAELLNAYHAWSLTYYRRADGSLTGEPACIANAVEYVLRLHVATAVNDFGPLALKQVRQSMIDAGQTRKWINDQMHRVRRAFRWGVENELVKADTLERLKSVTALAKGRTEAPEQREVKPVSFDTIERTLTKLKPKLAALVRFHLYSGCRAAEALTVRAGEIDTSAVPWVYHPAQHKTAHRGISKEIYLGPKARIAIEPLLQDRKPAEYLFTGRGRGPRHNYRGPVTASGYRDAVAAACHRAGVPVWLPRQLRHTWLTFIRKHRGIEAAQIIAGHSELNTTEIYAERDAELGRNIAESLG